MKPIALRVVAPPGWCAINRRIAGAHHLPPRYLAFREAVEQAVEQARDQGTIPVERPAWRALGVAVRSYWPRKHDKDPTLRGLALGDVDSPLKGVLDALQHAGVYDDDTRIVELVALKSYDPDCPRVEVELWEVVE